jgi:hypothetical protein
MGYSARYHVASLAAIFLALGVGILIGTGLGKNVINDTTRRLESSLKGDLLSARNQVSGLRDDLHNQQELAQSVYPALTNNTLPTGQIAVISLGSLDSSLQADIERTLGSDNRTGARIREFAVVREPPDVPALSGDLRGTPLHPLGHDAASLANFGRRAGRALVTGGPLFRRISGALLSRRSGKPDGINAVIVTRTPPENQQPAAAAATNGLESGILDGLEKTGLPVVAVERSGTDPSSMPLFRSHGLSTVDDLEATAGSVGLIYALRGARGSFGLGPGASRLLPPLTRLRRTTRSLPVPPSLAGSPARP